MSKGNLYMVAQLIISPCQLFLEWDLLRMQSPEIESGSWGCLALLGSIRVCIFLAVPQRISLQVSRVSQWSVAGLLQNLSINWTHLRFLLFVSDDVQVCPSPRLSSVDLHCCGERVMWNVWAMSKHLHGLHYKEELTPCWYKVDPLCFLSSLLRCIHVEQIGSKVICVSSLYPDKQQCFLMAHFITGLGTNQIQ